MTRKTLFSKVYRTNQLGLIESRLKRLLEDLDVIIDIAGIAASKWPQVEISGADEGIATTLIAQEIGFCPETVQAIQKSSVLKGYVVGIEDYGEGLNVDVGVFNPSVGSATVSLSHLQAQLADGRPLDISKLVESYGFCKDLPISLKISEIDLQKGRLLAELSTTQLMRFKSWIASLLDRLVVIGASYDEIRRVLDNAGLGRDVIYVEPLGIFEHTLTCKLGTDAAGLVSIVGRRLRDARFVVFNSRTLWKTQYGNGL